VNGALCAIAALALAACSGSDGDGGTNMRRVLPPGTGGQAASTSTGGTTASMAGTGGKSNAGMAGMTGGAGMAATGSGGMTPAPSIGSGGVAAMTGTGGAPAMTGTGGTDTAIDMPPPEMSSGCGAGTWPESKRYSIMVADLSREYIVKVPDGYDPSKPYKLIFAWHYLGGSAQGIAGGFGGGYYGLESMAGGSAIFVAPEGIDAAWPNTGGRDVAFAKAMVDWMRSNYCVDNKRIFSVGFSYGAIMSNTVGCQMGDVFRAIAPMSGSGPLAFGGASCKGPVAAWMSHGMSDTTVPFSSGQKSRDHWVMANGCQTTSKPVDPSPCVTYDGCMAGYPVTWCEFAGTHQQPSFGPAAIWKFFSQF
jgi:poly(3-hydroxybutyrate) depolymerase